MSQGNPWYQCMLGDEGIESSPAEKDLGVLTKENLDISCQCMLGAQKDCFFFLNSIARNMASKSRKVILPFYLCSCDTLTWNTASTSGVLSTKTWTC